MTPGLVLERIGYFPFAALGRFLLGDLTLPTVEQPWANNAPNVSCIPCGDYPLVRTTYYAGDGPGGKRDFSTWEIVNVPGRSLIKIHPANFASQLRGCIAPGTGYMTDGNVIGVQASITAFETFSALMNALKPEFISVRNAAPGGIWRPA